ncbi:phosphatidate cytidylyltransferase [Myxococcota bacterium]|nr:phosphatidate cytidylyltransferase [Myxococcota bacterium]
MSEAPLHPQPATPLEPKPRRQGGDLRPRLLTAAILIPAVIYVITQGGLTYLAVVVIIVLLGEYEIYELLREKGAHPAVGLGMVAGALLPVISFYGSVNWSTIMITAALLATMVMELRRQRINEAMASISGTFFGIVYVGWLLSHAVVLRNFDHSVIDHYGAGAAARLGVEAGTGAFLMLYTLFVVVLCDAGAYFAGRAYGRRKLASAISPGKTVEGALGGILAGVVGGCLAKAGSDVFWPQFSHLLDWQATVGFAVILAIVGIVGDLTESLLKRDADVKDAGRLLPGMGGVLDRIDAPLLAIPVMYYLMLFYVYPRI